MNIFRKYVFFGIILIFLNWGIGFVLIKTYLEMQDRQAIRSLSPKETATDVFWANKILKGGYILYFRHAEREKWNTATVYDWEEVNGNLDGRTETWKDAVCLTEKGIEDAKLLGRVLKEINMNVSKVISSPSCRARETAFYALRGPEEVWLSALHATAITDRQESNFKITLKKLLALNAPPPNKNLIVFAHGNTLNTYQEDIFVGINFADDKWEIDELGFFVLQLNKEGIVAQHAFQNFSDFANSILEYDEN